MLIMLAVCITATVPAGAQTTTITQATALYNPSTDQTTYSFAGTASGYAGNNYTVTIEIKDDFGVVIASLTQSFNPSVPGWSKVITGAKGGTNFNICISEAPGKGTAGCVTGRIDYLPPIPTLSEWAMIIMGVLLLGLMTYYVIKRKRTAKAVAF